METGTYSVREISRRLSESRSCLLARYPFFGHLLLRMPFGLADCETAYTDMQRIVFDPDFAMRLPPQELQFVMLHELMHCVLRHCIRAAGFQPELFNIACDIVVNSFILEAIRADTFQIDGSEVMHLAPDGTEGRLHTAEEVYAMLLHNSDSVKLAGLVQGFDKHDAWAVLTDLPYLDAQWETYIREADRRCTGSEGVPGDLQRYLREVDHAPRTNWRQLLNDFIKADRADFVFSPPDRRFTDRDFVLPSFQENIFGEQISRLWFFVDSSGSISEHMLGEIFFEIKCACEQIDALSGTVAFFDRKVHNPMPFSSVDDLQKAEAVGGGGTSFFCIFDYLDTLDEADAPCAVIILTDGYAAFPPQSRAGQVPVLWVITTDVTPPWGESVYIDTGR